MDAPDARVTAAMTELETAKHMLAGTLIQLQPEPIIGMTALVELLADCIGNNFSPEGDQPIFDHIAGLLPQLVARYRERARTDAGPAPSVHGHVTKAPGMTLDYNVILARVRELQWLVEQYPAHIELPDRRFLITSQMFSDIGDMLQALHQRAGGEAGIVATEQALAEREEITCPGWMTGAKSVMLLSEKISEAPTVQYATVERLGPKQSMLAHGALLIRDVPLARTGTQFYHASEIPGAIDGDTAIDDAGMVEVVRDESEVFDPRSVASFEGASVVMQHPDGVVSPGNWSDLAVGHVQNVRREDDLLIGDLLIHDARGIAAIREHGWKAISAGYDANYSPATGGRLRQIDISGNHIALLAPNEQARCGERCAVGDQAWTYGGDTMTRDQVSAGYSVASVSALTGNVGYSQRVTDPFARGAPEGSTFFPSGSLGAQKGEGPVGPRRILKLDGPASAYVITSTADGETWLCFSGKADGVLDPGRTLGNRPNSFVADAQRRARNEQARNEIWAAGIKDFWQKQQARA
jgi:hypothetical protein